MGDGAAEFGMLLPPGGEGWTVWAHDPPRYKRGRVVELWREVWGNETSFIALDHVTPQLITEGLWWRPA